MISWHKRGKAFNPLSRPFVQAVQSRMAYQSQQVSMGFSSFAAWRVETKRWNRLTMARNIEIKAKVSNIADLMERSKHLATSSPTVIHQDDTFFGCANGHMKLRAFQEGHGQLIFYRRENSEGPKTSFYDLAPTHDADRLRITLSLAYGQVGRVIKERTLYFVGRTRIHIDRVQDLGDFMELEVVLRDGEDARPHCDMPRDIFTGICALLYSLITRICVNGDFLPVQQ
jgi:adenylate cyclase class IV